MSDATFKGRVLACLYAIIVLLGFIAGHLALGR